MQILNAFRRNKPQPEETNELYTLVRTAMEGVQAYARSHGGKIDLLGVTDEGDVRIRLTGACSGCPMSDLTLKHGIEEQLRAAIPGIRQVIEVK